MAIETKKTPGDILLDAGTNELEVLVFKLAGGWYGVNVAKVREVIQPIETTKSPGRHESVIGMFTIRGSVLPMIDLAGHLGLRERMMADPEDGSVIITEFNDQQIGFHVDEMDQIHRMSWSLVKPAPQMNETNIGVITGIIEQGDELILMLDFESIADEINLEEKLHVGAVENEFGVDRASKRVILAEDSPFMRQRLTEVFIDSGYEKLEVYTDGQLAWDAISAEGGAPIDAIVSDIEMPRMDGLHMTTLVRAHPVLKNVPLLLFSSLISSDNKKKGEQVGATLQIAKPELKALVLLVDRMVSGMPIDESMVEESRDVAA